MTLVEKMPPNILYHGTNHKAITGILARGIVPKMDTFTHLTDSSKVAHDIALKHGGRIVICTINTKKMYEDGYKFYLDENNVWNVEHVPTKYFKATFINTLKDLNDLPKEIVVK